MESAGDVGRGCIVVSREGDGSGRYGSWLCARADFGGKELAVVWARFWEVHCDGVLLWRLDLEGEMGCEV